MFITALYAILLVPVFLVLSLSVIKSRRQGKIGLGDGGQKELLRRMRAHANFAEYVPFTLLLMALAESLSAHLLILHACGICLFFGRVLHAYGISQEPEPMTLRVIGMALTFTVMITLATTGLWRLAASL